MLGAIIGDLVGSPFEGGACRDWAANLRQSECEFTDDTVLTIAVAEALLEKHDISQTLRKWTRRYPNRGYGGAYLKWASADDAKPFQSYSNGGAMRVSPVSLAASTLSEAIDLATYTASPTHGHEEGLRGAHAIAAAIYLARTGEQVEDIRTCIANRFGYGLTWTVAQRAETFGFSTLAEDTVPDALTAALEAASFEHALRNALYIGGDSDTIACMAGAIAEARFGIPAEYQPFLAAQVPVEMFSVLNNFYSAVSLPSPLQGWVAEGPSQPSSFLKAITVLRRLFQR
jgi:ADP-ribosylglycohydrolase